MPDCDSFYREPIDRIANIDRIARSLPRVFPTFTRAPTISQLCPRLRVLPATIRTDVEGEEKNPVRRIVSPSVNHRIIDSWILIARSRSITIIYRTVTIFPSPSFDHRIFPTLGLLLLLHISCFFESNRSVLSIIFTKKGNTRRDNLHDPPSISSSLSIFTDSPKQRGNSSIGRLEDRINRPPRTLHIIRVRIIRGRDIGGVQQLRGGGEEEETESVVAGRLSSL